MSVCECSCCVTCRCLTVVEKDASHDDCRLLQTLQDLQELASLDSSFYVDRLKGNQLPTTPPFETTTTTPAAMNHVLEGLASSIHRLHSLVSTLSIDCDLHTTELEEQRQQWEANQQSLERTMRKVCHRYQRLTHRYEQDQESRRLLQQKVINLEESLRQQAFDQMKWQSMARQLDHHERRLLIKSTTASNELLVSSCVTSKNNDDPKTSTSEEQSLASSSSSLITDHGIATVQFLHRPSRARLGTWSHPERPTPFANSTSTADTIIRDKEEDAVVVEETRLVSPLMSSTAATTNQANTIPSTHDNPIDRSKSAKEEQRTRNDNDAIPQRPTTALFSAATSFTKKLLVQGLKPQPQTYSLTFAKPFDMQYCVLPLSQAQLISNAQPMSSSSSKSIAVGNSSPATAVPVKKRLVVCGYLGFDATVNAKPPIGAQLLLVDNESIPSWIETSQELEDYVRQISNKVVTMTFRNECWDETQRATLNAAVVNQKPNQVHHVTRLDDPASLLQLPSAAATKGDVSGGMSSMGALWNRLQKGHSSDAASDFLSTTPKLAKQDDNREVNEENDENLFGKREQVLSQ